MKENDLAFNLGMVVRLLDKLQSRMYVRTSIIPQHKELLAEAQLILLKIVGEKYYSKKDETP